MKGFRRVDIWLWLAAILLFGVMDILLTFWGLNLPGVVESNPTGRVWLAAYGVGGMFLGKLFAFGLALALYWLAPEEWRRGVPIGLLALGVVVGVHNAMVIVVASGG